MAHYEGERIDVLSKYDNYFLLLIAGDYNVTSHLLKKTFHADGEIAGVSDVLKKLQVEG